MQILSLVLTNFKTHRDRAITFEPGINAISGENGAGKTSILEAIAWTLFDCNSGYTKKELIRQGASSAQVAVTFISADDDRTYRVKRCTTKGYELYDPQLGKKLAEESDRDVIRWLKKHLGIAESVELSKLFADTIGIPQGTFTVDFLKSATERRRVFDPILKVEAYKQAFKDSASLESYAKAQVRELEQTIAQYQTSLADWDSLKQDYATCEQEIQHQQSELQQLEQQLDQWRIEKEQMTTQAKDLQQLDVELQTFKTRLINYQYIQQNQSNLLAAAQQAAIICQANQVSYRDYQQAESTLHELGKRNQQKQRLITERDRHQAQLNELRIRSVQLQTQLDSFTMKRSELQQLVPLIQQQIDLESQRQSLDQQLQKLQILKTELHTLERQQLLKQTEQAALLQECDRLSDLNPFIQHIPDLEAQVQRMQQHLARLNAAQQFQIELGDILIKGRRQFDLYLHQAKETITLLRALPSISPTYAPAIDIALATIDTGQEMTLELLERLQKIYDDIADQADEAQLQQQLETTNNQLTTLYHQRVQFQTLPSKQQQYTSLEAELQQIRGQLLELQVQVAQEPDLQQQRSQCGADLQALNDPHGRYRLLEEQLQQEPQIQAEFQQQSQRQQAMQTQVAAINEKLASFGDLEEQIEQQQEHKQTQQPGYLLYVQNQNEANSLSSRQRDLESTVEELADVERQQTQQSHLRNQLAQEHDAPRLAQVEAIYSQGNDRRNHLLGGLPGKRENLHRLAGELDRRTTIATQLTTSQAQLAEKQTLQQFILDARKIYNDGAPRITRFYIEQISREADRLFRELMNRQNLALRWTEDYEIQVQEGAYWRNFKTLSGGEQMSAALAVRLALLRVFADIDVAFFDEPTMNMDITRRRHLAEALGNLKTFRQLLVISHDDTFETITENVIRVERE